MSKPTKNPSGYNVVTEFTHRVFNIALALVLIVCALPFFLVLAILVKLRIGGSPIYKGERLGKDKKIFVMYKFRTLVPGADHVIGAELLTQKIAAANGLQTDFGKYLRSTRLDELPQLFNILKGDMNFIGPRPERPEIYEKICRHIWGYDQRFSVKPGLIGYSQLLTPHSTPKRIRTFIDNKFLHKNHRVLIDLWIILKTITAVLGQVIELPFRYLWHVHIRGKRLGVRKNRRSLERTSLKAAAIYLGREDGGRIRYEEIGRIKDINEDALLAYSNEPVFPSQASVKLEVNTQHLLRPRRKTKAAICTSAVYSRTEIPRGPYRYGYVLRYVPRSSLDYYLVHQYFLQMSIIKP